MGTAVTDPKVLAMLNGGGDAPSASSTSDSNLVQDPQVLAQLNGTADTMASADHLTKPKKTDPLLPVLIDRVKSGVAGTLAIPNAAVSAIGTLTDAVHLTDSKGMKAGDVEVTKPGETFGGYTMAKRGWDEVLGVKHFAVPKDLQGRDSKANEYLATSAEFLGGSLIPGASTVANASRKLVTATVIGIGNLGAGTGAVEGKELGENLAEKFGLPKDFGGQMGYALGSLTGPKLVGMAGQYAVKTWNVGQQTLAANDITGFSADAQKAAANSLLQKDVQTALQHAPESEANVARAIELKKKAEQFSPNIAQMTDAPGLKAMYREVTNKSPEALAKAQEWERRNTEAIANYKEKTFPKNEQSVTDPARIKLSSDRSVLEMGIQNDQRQLRELSSKFRRELNNDQIGEELRTLYWDSRTRAKAQVDSQLADVYGTARKYGVKDDVSDIRDAVAKITGSDKNTFQDMPVTFRKILDEYPAATPDRMNRVAVTPNGAKSPVYRTEVVKGSPGKSEATFEEMHSLYKQANKDYADAVIGGNSTKAFYMKTVKEMLGEKIAKYNDEKYGELAKKFQNYNKNYAQYSTTYREGAGGEIAKRGRGGLATDAEDIVSKVILQAGDKKKGVQDFFQVYGGDERAAQLLHDGLIDNFSKSAMKGGVLNPKAAQSWLDKHASALSELPETKKVLEQAQGKAEVFQNRILMQQKQRQVLDRTVLSKIAKSDKPEDIINKSIADPKYMKGLLAGANTQDSKQAIARALVDSITKRPDSYEYLMKNEKALKPALDALGKDHWQNLKDIAEMEQISARTKAPTSVELAKLQDIGEQTIGTSVKGMFSRLRNLDKPMGVSKEYLVMDVGGRFFYKVRSEELARLREHAMVDPEAASLLSKLGKRDSASRQDLLDLQAISYVAGVNSLVQERSEQVREEKRKGR